MPQVEPSSAVQCDLRCTSTASAGGTTSIAARNTAAPGHNFPARLFARHVRASHHNRTSPRPHKPLAYVLGVSSALLCWARRAVLDSSGGSRHICFKLDSRRAAARA